MEKTRYSGRVPQIVVSVDLDLQTPLRSGKRTSVQRSQTWPQKRKRGNYSDNRGVLTGRVSIEQCPQVFRERSRLGDLEIDLIMGKAHKSALLVITDRATMLTAIEKVPSRKVKTMASTIIEKHQTVSNSFIKIITLDNDKAFANHQQIARELQADVYFSRPYTSEGKRTVENRIGVIR